MISGSLSSGERAGVRAGNLFHCMVTAKKFGLLAILFSTGIIFLRAQTPQRVSGTGFQAVYREGEKLKAILSGKSAKQVTGSQVFVTDFRMKILRNSDTNQVELIAEAPECLFDRNTSVASSPGPMKAYTVTTNLYIRGLGFFCQQSNALLVISNKVETRINKSLFNTNSAGNSFPASGKTSTNQLLIFSDHFRFLLESNLVTYTGNVRVDDPQMELTCDSLNIVLTTNKTIQQIIAENRVVIVNKKDNSRATGDHATYTLENNREMVELTGHPFWSDGEREGQADKFIFDRANNLFRAEQNVVFKVPRHKLIQLDALNLSAVSTTTNAAAQSRVIVSSDVMTFKMPTNGPIQEMLAETNVVITSESDQSRATAERAIYREATGLMELTGNPNWKMKESAITGEVLVFGRTNHFFGARTNVYLKLPAAMFGKTFAAGSSTNSRAAQIVEIWSDDFSYRTNLATFREHVRAKTVDTNLSQTLLRCHFLAVSFGASNQVEVVVAKQNVFLQQIVGAAALSKILERTITGQSVQLNRSPSTGLFESIHARTKVVGEQTERTGTDNRSRRREEADSRHGRANPPPHVGGYGEGQLSPSITVKRISAERVDIKFLPTTNQIESIVAEQNVLLEKIEQIGSGRKQIRANGERAVYDSAGDLAELTGQPSAATDTLLISDATTLRWDLKTGKMSARPYKVTPLNSANAIRPEWQKP